MVLFPRRPRIVQLAAVHDVVGLRDALAEAARSGAARVDKLNAAASALVDLGEDGIRALVDVILTDPEHAHFGWIADETFHRAACPVAVAQLSDALLHHPDADLRLVAAMVLRRLETSLADEAFAIAVEDGDPHVRLAAARGLADHGDGRGLRALVDWAAHADDPGPALDGIVRLGDVRLVAILERLRDTRADAKAAAQIDRAIGSLRDARARRHPQGPVARLEAVRDQLRSIEVVDRIGAGTLAVGSRTTPAHQQIVAICADIDRAVAALRTGRTADGRSIAPAGVGTALGGLLAEVAAREPAGRMSSGLDPRGVRAFQLEVAELERIATDLQEGTAVPDRAAPEAAS